MAGRWRWRFPDPATMVLATLRCDWAGGLKQYLNIFDYAVVAQLSFGGVSRGRKGVRGDIEQRAIAVICDIQRSNGDCEQLVTSASEGCRRHTATLVAQEQGVLLGFTVDSPHAS